MMPLLRYIKAAFNARPWGMWIPPNWVGLAAFGLLGLESHGFLIMGAGLELAYLLGLATSARFQRVIDSKSAYQNKRSTQQQIISLLARLDPKDQTRYRALEARCQKVLQQQSDASATPPQPGELQLQADGMSKLLFVYLRLLLTRSAIMRVLQGAGGGTGSIDARINEVSAQLENARIGNASPELQHSLSDQITILSERKKRHAEAREKLQFIEAELSRIQEQVELIREGMVVTTDPASLSRRIDQVGGTLGSTTQWIQQQRELLGDTANLLDDESPITLEVPLPTAAPMQKA